MSLFNNKIFKVLYTTLKVCFIFIVASYLLFIIIQRLSGNRSIFGYRLFNVATGSMKGVYNVNDVIIVKDCDTKSLKVGDDIAYQGVRGGLEGKLVTHRIIKKEKKSNGGYMYTTKGVVSEIEDPSINESQILGKVVGVLPVISHLNHAIKSQAGFFLLVFIPLVLVIVLEVLQTITDIKIEKNEIQRIDKNSENDEEESSSNEENIEVL